MTATLRNITLLLFGAALILALPACALVEDMQTKLFDTTKVNLTDTTYAAADMLAQQTRPHMTQTTPLRTGMITDVAHPGETTPFGRQIANELGSRFVQLGYNVRALPETPATLSGAPLPLGGSPHITPENGPKGSDCTITGSYARLKNTIIVSLRIIQGPDRHIIAAYDYSLPRTIEMDDLSKPAAERRADATANKPAFWTN